MTAEQLAEFKDGLERMLPWAITYRHLESFQKVLRLGRMAASEIVPKEPEKAEDQPA